jgi:uncharacterized membrane protein
MTNITKKEIIKGIPLSIISYFGPLSFLTLIISNNKYVLFHSKQSLRLFIIYIIPFIVFTKLEQKDIMWRFSDITISIIIIFIIYMSLTGINNAMRGKMKDLPIINKIFQRKKK